MALICSYSLIPLNLLTCREHKGIIVGLGEEGKLTCSYLGTDPTVFTASPSTRRDVSFEVMMHTGPAPAVATTRYKWQSFKWQISCQQKLTGLATEVHFGGDFDVPCAAAQLLHSKLHTCAQLIAFHITCRYKHFKSTIVCWASCSAIREAHPLVCSQEVQSEANVEKFRVGAGILAIGADEEC